MCLLLVAVDEAGDYPVQLAANRDEFHARGAEALHWWPDRPGIVGGRDRRAGGTWLAASTAGRFATVLNDPRFAVPPGAPSRGELIPGVLAAPDPLAWLERLTRQRRQYAGFHFVAGLQCGIAYCASASPAPMWLEAGLHVINNAGLDVDDPRSRRASDRVGTLLRASADADSILDALADKTVPGHGGGDCRPLFINDSTFGTRCSTVLRLDRDGGVHCRERAYNANGAVTGDTAETWTVSESAGRCRT